MHRMSAIEDATRKQQKKVVLCIRKFIDDGYVFNIAFWMCVCACAHMYVSVLIFFSLSHSL